MQKVMVEDIIDAVTDGDASSGVSITKLSTLVSEITGKVVTMRASTKWEPIAITDAADEGYFSLVMGMRV